MLIHQHWALSSSISNYLQLFFFLIFFFKTEFWGSWGLIVTWVIISDGFFNHINEQ